MDTLAACVALGLTCLPAPVSQPVVPVVVPVIVNVPKAKELHLAPLPPEMTRIAPLKMFPIPPAIGKK